MSGSCSEGAASLSLGSSGFDSSDLALLDSLDALIAVLMDAADGFVLLYSMLRGEGVTTASDVFLTIFLGRSESSSLSSLPSNSFFSPVPVLSLDFSLSSSLLKSTLSHTTPASVSCSMSTEAS